MLKLKQLRFNLILLMALCAALTIISCSSDDDGEPENQCEPNFSTSVASGKFMGDPFTFVEGTASENFADETEFRVFLYGENVVGDACDGFNFEKPDSSIIFTVPMEVGVYPLTLTDNVTFNDASIVNEVNADLAICGAIEILSITDTEITGRLDASANADSELNGTFTLVRCD